MGRALLEIALVPPRGESIWIDPSVDIEGSVGSIHFERSLRRSEVEAEVGGQDGKRRE